MKRNLSTLISSISLALFLTGCGSGGGGGSSSITQEYLGDDIGANMQANGDVTFKVWLPTASSSSIALYAADNSDLSLGDTIALVKADDFDDTGIWQITVKATDIGVSDLTGVFYQLKVNGTDALDPYARSLEASTGTYEADASTTKAAIINHQKYQWTNSGYATLADNWKREDAIVYEMHVRDFTVDPSVEADLNDEKFGTYSAFIEKLDYLQDLGITHIQLLPVQASFYGNETTSGTREWDEKSTNNNYNWGYDPHSYFAPEGMYASDVNDAQSRVDELKSLIDAIHGKGMAVTLDVVYNHHPFNTLYEPLVAGYYYRENSRSGAGIDIASEKPMVSKLIIDSLTYWTKEFKVDGFRFDLMGLIDANTIQTAYEESAKLNPKTLYIGEGWKMCGDCTSVTMADQDWMPYTDDVATFNDSIRNLIKSGYGGEGQPRFISGGQEDTADLFRNLQANPDDGNYSSGVDAPGDVLQYIAAHDNLTLHDVIAVAIASQNSSKTVANAEDEIHRRIRLGNTLILTSQGTAFLHGGQEYGRTKACAGCGNESTTSEAGDKFVHNSYDASDLVNHFDWSAVTDAGIQKETMEFTKGLISLRKSSDAFRLATASDITANMELIATGDVASNDNVIAYVTKSSDGADTFYLFMNAGDEIKVFNVNTDLTSGELLVDGDNAGTSPISSPVDVTVTASKVTLQPLTATVIKM